MCNCAKRDDIKNVNDAIVELKKQRIEFEARQLAGDQTVGASLVFIDNVLAMFDGDCPCKKVNHNPVQV